MPNAEQPLCVAVSDAVGTVSAVLQRPEDPKALLVLAHGAGAGMHHPFMAQMAALLQARHVAVLRFQFPYTERGGKRPDLRPRLVETVAAALLAASDALPGVPVFAGGKSMGGRMTSHLAEGGLPRPVAGLVFLGFPLHPAGKEGVARASHLGAIQLPMLFVQGTRDKLACMSLITEVVQGLGARARMHVIADADHGFAVPKRTGRTQDAVLAEAADAIEAFIDSVVP